MDLSNIEKSIVSSKDNSSAFVNNINKDRMQSARINQVKEFETLDNEPKTSEYSNKNELDDS